MKCLKCGRDIDDNVKVCPYCDHKITDEEIELDLPSLKKEDDFKLERTRSISPIHDSELSLIDDIKEEIDKDSKYVDNGNGIDEIGEVNVGDDVGVSSNSINSVLETKDSLRTRKNILGFCAILTVIAAILMVVVVAGNKKEKSTKQEEVNYLEKYHQALNKYYETDDIDDIIIMIKNYRNDSEKIEEIQRKTRITCDSWLLTYTGEKLEKREDFEAVTKKYETFLYGLNNYAVATADDGKEIKALPDSDYLLLNNQLTKVYEDGMVFFDSLDLYNEKDYNKAYSTFGVISKDNTYYDKAVYYMGKIVDNVMDLLIKDVEKLEKGLDTMSDDEKLARYVSIEQVILEYDNVYVSINLTKNESYNRMLKTCREQIDIYSKKTS